MHPNAFPNFSVPFFASLTVAGGLAYIRVKLTSFPLYPLIFIGLILCGQIPLLLTGEIGALQHFSIWAIIFLAALIVYLIATHHSESIIVPLLKIYALAAACWVIVATPVWLGWTDGSALSLGPLALTTDLQMKINGPFANGNVFGIMTACAWCISWHEWIRHPSKTGRAMWWFAMLIFWIWSIGSMSLGVWLAESLAIILMITHMWREPKKRLLIFIITAVVACTAANELAGMHASEKLEATQQIHSLIESRTTPRLLLWESVSHIILKRPVLGVGLGNLSAHYLDGQATALSLSNTDKEGLFTNFSAHNFLLHLWVEAGLSGLLLWLVITIVLLLSLKQHLQRGKVCSPSGIALMCALMLWLQGCFNISLNLPYSFICFTLFLAWATSSLKPIQTRQINISPTLLISFLAVILVHSFWGMVQTTHSWITFSQWVTKDLSIQANNDEAKALIGDETVDPILIELWARNVMLSKNTWNPAETLPYIQYALNIVQRPILLREAFAAHMALGQFNEACRIGTLLKHQRWKKDEKNLAAYASACENRPYQGPITLR